MANKFREGDVVLYRDGYSEALVHHHDDEGVWVRIWRHDASVWCSSPVPQLLHTNAVPHPEADRVSAEYTAALLLGEFYDKF